MLIDGPYGVFTQDRCRSAKALLIAAGIGITPIRSLAEAMARSGMDVTVLYGNRTRGEIVFFDELEALTKEFPNRAGLPRADARPRLAGRAGKD